MRILLSAFVLLTLLTSAAAAQTNSFPRVILPGDYPDPTIVRDGSDYYMTHSPFVYAPGFLIWHSTDLINWRPLTRTMTAVKGSAYAPDLIKHDGKYYIYYPSAGTNWVIWANSILGPWSDPIDLKVGRIDPGHVVGEDGKRYLHLSAGMMVKLSDDGLSTDGEMFKTYDGWRYPKEWVTECFCLESPKLTYKDGYYYLTSAQGGTAGPPTSHMVVSARSTSVKGPWENAPDNPIVRTYSAEEQWWSQGHGTVIDDVNGNWWIVYHAYENGQYPLGRQTLLAPIEWTDEGWPRVAETAHPLEPAPMSEMQFSDDFSGKKLDLQWMTWGGFSGISLRDERLCLTAKGTSPKDARLLLVTARDHAYEVQVEVNVPNGGIGGLILFYSDRAFAGISTDGKNLTVYRSVEQASTEPSPFGSHLFLKIINRNNHCDFLAGSDGKTWTPLLADVDVSEMHHNNFRGFLALRPALMAAGNGEVQFDNFVYDAKESDVAKTPERPSDPFGNALIPDLAADASIVEFDGTFYCYATTDGWGRGLETSGTPVVWKSRDFLNWSFQGSIFSDDFDAKYWAPSNPVRRNGRYYLFPTLDGKIAAVVADLPEGPFRGLDGRNITRDNGWEPYPIATQPSSIDAHVFVDDDDQAYMVWSRRRIVKLKPDLSEPEGPHITFSTKRGGYSEGPFLFKRNGIYYYLYTLGGHEDYKYAYMISRQSPLGPWETPEQDIIAVTDHDEGVYGPGHGCFFSPEGSDQWYFVYLEYGRGSTNRQIYADRMMFNEDGTIRPIKVTKAGVGALRSEIEKSPNLALNAMVAASSIQPDYRVPPRADGSLDRIETFVPANAVDGSNGSRWMAAADDQDAWWQVDLGAARRIERTEAYFVKPAAGHAYMLEVSTDGITWQPYGGHDEVILQSPHVDSKTAVVRYIRLTFLKGTAGLWEFRVY